MEISNQKADELLNDPRNWRNRTAASESSSSPLTSNPEPEGKEGNHAGLAETVHLSMSPSRGRGSRGESKNLPYSFKVLLGATAELDGVKKTAEAFGVSTGTVQNTKQGLVGKRFDEELKKDVDAAVGKEKQSMRDLALERMATMFASVITPENLATVKSVKDAVSVAKDLAIIADRVTSKQPGNGVTVIFHTPRTRAEEEYDTVDIIATPVAKKVSN